MKMVKRALSLVGIVILIVFGIVYFRSGGDKKPSPPTSVNDQPSNEVQVVSTTPANLNNSTILPTQSIEVTFNKALLDSVNIRYDLSPAAPHHIELSSDNKTLRIIPDPQFTLGQNYTLTIHQDTKLKDGTTLGRDFSFNFTTITYSGV